MINPLIKSILIGALALNFIACSSSNDSNDDPKANIPSTPAPETPTDPAGNEPEPSVGDAPYAVDLYLRGQMNGWSFSDAEKFTYIGNNQYELQIELEAIGYEFKVADNEWSVGTNFGAPTDALDSSIELGSAFTTNDQGGNLVMTLETASYYRFLLDATDATTPVLTVSLSDFEDTPAFSAVTIEVGDQNTTMNYLGQGLYQTELSLAVGQSNFDIIADGVLYGAQEILQFDTETPAQLDTQSLIDVAIAGTYQISFNVKNTESPLILISYLGAPTTQVIHYQRCIDDYTNWEVHIWGNAIDASQITTWAEDTEFDEFPKDDFGATFEIDIKRDIQPLNFIVHRNGDKDGDEDRTIIPRESNEIWLRQGELDIHTSEPNTANENCVAVAFVGPDRLTGLNVETYLDGYSSLVANTFNWSISAQPESGTPYIATPNSVSTHFITDGAGEYAAELEINQGTSDADTASFNITAVQLQPVKYIMLFIGDGMGFEHVQGAGLLNGTPGELSFETLPFQGEVFTASASTLAEHAEGAYTDSAAAATAMSTGRKVTNGVISLAEPGDHTHLTTLTQFANTYNYSTGLVTSAWATHATPAAFGSHTLNRESYDDIGAEYFESAILNVIIGGGGYGVTPALAEQAGYAVAQDKQQLQTIASSVNAYPAYVSGQFGLDHLPYENNPNPDYPSLAKMTTNALDILEHDENGFFLMVEGARIDHAGHGNILEETLTETIAFADAVEVAMNWAKFRTDTLIIVTADHETGGLDVDELNSIPGQLPSATFSTGTHTSVNVPIYAWGPNAEFIDGRLIDNTDINNLLRGSINKSSMVQDPVPEPTDELPEETPENTVTVE